MAFKLLTHICSLDLIIIKEHHSVRRQETSHARVRSLSLELSSSNLMVFIAPSAALLETNWHLIHRGTDSEIIAIRRLCQQAVEARNASNLNDAEENERSSHAGILIPGPDATSRIRKRWLT